MYFEGYLRSTFTPFFRTFLWKSAIVTASAFLALILFFPNPLKKLKNSNNRWRYCHSNAISGMTHLLLIAQLWLLGIWRLVRQCLESCIWLAAYMQNPSNILSTDKITNSPSQSPRHQYPYRKISSLGIYPVLLIGIWSRLKSRSVLGSAFGPHPILILIWVSTKSQ